MFKTILLAVMCQLCASTADDIIIYKNEVTKDIETYIFARTFTLLVENNDLKLVANKLRADLNKKHGNGWQCIASATYNLSDIETDREPNTLFWFSFVDKYFYIFKTVTENRVISAAANMKNATIWAKTAEPVVMFRIYVSNDSHIESDILKFTKSLILKLDVNCDFETINYNGNVCLYNMLNGLLNHLQNTYPNYRWVVSIGERHSMYFGSNTPPFALFYTFNDLYFMVEGFTYTVKYFYNATELAKEL